MIESILRSTLSGLYTQLGSALLVSILFMVVWQNAKESSWKEVIKGWLIKFRTDKSFRAEFFFTLFVALILFRTIFCRSVWSTHPLKNVFGIWGLYDDRGEIYTEGIQNCILFIPFTALLMNMNMRNETSVLKAVLYAFFFSTAIELTQLLLKCGEFQLSDIFYNSLGGFIGGIIYWLFKKVKENGHNKSLQG